MARCSHRLSLILRHFISAQQMPIHHPVKMSSTLSTPSGSRYLTTDSSTLRQIDSLKEQVNDIDIHYEKTGKGDHPVLLLPGALGCSKTDFEPQLKGLSEDKYTLIAMDPRGCGQSRPPNRDWPLNFLQRDADDAAALMKALSYSRYSVVGWSDGANSSMILAAANPGTVTSLVIWGGNSYVAEADYELYKKIENIDSWSPSMRKTFIDYYGEDYFRELWAGWIEVQRNIYTKRNGDICIGSLPNIKCSTLLINGVKDALVPQEQPLFLQKHILNCRMEIWPQGKHNLHIRYAKEFNALVEEFLDKEWALQG